MLQPHQIAITPKNSDMICWPRVTNDNTLDKYGYSTRDGLETRQEPHTLQFSLR